MSTQQWRLWYRTGGLVHYTEWCDDFDRVAALYEQYRRGLYAQRVRIEHREVVHDAG